MVDYRHLRERMRTPKGRSVLTFMGFWAVAAFFWLLLALNDDTQRDFLLPLQLADFPQDVTVLTGNVPLVGVSVRDRGSALMRFSASKPPALKVSYNDFAHSRPDHLLMTQSQLSGALRQLFGANATIVGVRPDSLDLFYTTEPGHPVAVRLDAQVHTAPQCVAFGMPQLSADTVMLYSTDRRRMDVEHLTTAPLTLTDLTDTTRVEARLLVPQGMRAVPSTVTVTVPVEPLMTKTRSLPIEARNVPTGMHLVAFPSMADISYLLPKSQYAVDNPDVHLYVDYAEAAQGASTPSLPLHIAPLPKHITNPTLSRQEVEFVLEHK